MIKFLLIILVFIVSTVSCSKDFIPIDPCKLKKDPGSGDENLERYYYDQECNECLPFTYYGCEGNENNFLTRADCEWKCCHDIVPVDPCKQKKDRGTCYGNFPRYYYNQKLKKCLTFMYGGCDGNKNNFLTKEDCEWECIGDIVPIDPCKQKNDSGPCKGYFPRYYYNQKLEKCQEFIYGGCKGNKNNFLTKKDCEWECIDGSIPTDPCKQPMESGPCDEVIPRFYYDQECNECLPFTYGGCDGNENNFRTKEDCEWKCLGGGIVSVDPCQQHEDHGPCIGNFPRFYYDQEEKKCLPFRYGGCFGNDNNFLSKTLCELQCGGGIPTDPCKQSKDSGLCNGQFDRYYYDQKEKKCLPFTYGGCDGNDNNFLSKALCELQCGGGIVSVDPCKQVKKCGSCNGHFLRYYFDQKKQECLTFRYGGCDGNENNFLTKAECEKTCYWD